METTVVVRSDSNGDGTPDTTEVLTVSAVIAEMESEESIEIAAAQARATKLGTVRNAVYNALDHSRMAGFTRDYVVEMGSHTMLGIDGINYSVFVSEDPINSYTGQKLYAQMARENGHDIADDWTYCSNDKIGYVLICTGCGELMSIPRVKDQMSVYMKPNGSMHRVRCTAADHAE